MSCGRKGKSEDKAGFRNKKKKDDKSVDKLVPKTDSGEAKVNFRALFWWICVGN